MAMRWPWQHREPPYDPQSCPNIPDPVDEQPPEDQYCDLVLNGGVASGVVYPWALVGLARTYRFRNIGGNSVGAVAAAVAAAAEYGRCNGVHHSFEALRRMPAYLAKEDDCGRARMLTLFQPRHRTRRFLKIFVRYLKRYQMPRSAKREYRADKSSWRWWISTVVAVYGMWWPLLGVLLASVVGPMLLHCFVGWSCWQALTAAVASAAVGLVIWALAAYVLLARDLNALADNDYGVCPGNSQDGRTEGLVEWLHRGIQLSAGRGEDDPPLTFADLWAAPRGGQRGPAPRPDGGQPDEAGIGLTMFTSNVTLGRPVRLPLDEPATRLYYLPKEWERLFPECIMKALAEIAVPYTPRSASDPHSPASVRVGPSVDGHLTECRANDLMELPMADMPIVVAARLSLCFPLLFQLVPVYAMDYEAPRAGEYGQPSNRTLRRCLLADGGLCSNFPVHLFDRAHPRWPTFALLLDRRLQDYAGEPVWLPRTHLEGRADNWQREVPGAERPDPTSRKTARRDTAIRFGGVALGMLLTMKDWNDRVTGRLPTVRNRVLRIALKRGEGELNIAMRGATMMRMAHEYGNVGAERLLKQFAPVGRDGAGKAWHEHCYVRAVTELRALRRHLSHYTKAVNGRASGKNVTDLLQEATRERPLARADQRPIGDPAGQPLTAANRDALQRAINAVCELEAELARCEPHFGPYQPEPMPDLRLRPPV